MLKQCCVLIISFFATVLLRAQTITVNQLRCEGRTTVAGINSPLPRFSWEINSTQQDVVQTAYRIMVADDPVFLYTNNPNCWDSRKVNSNTSIQVSYKGRALQGGQTYYWRVMVWDNKGNVSSWSDAASWQEGLLTSGDWKQAQWIGYERLPDAQQIVPFAHGKGKKEWGSREDILPLFRREFNIKKAVRRATVFISGLGQFEMHVNGEKIGDHFLDPGWTQYSKSALYVNFDITKQLKQGANAIGVMLGNGFYYIPGERYRKLTGGYGYPKLIARVAIEYKDGSVENIVSNSSWKTAPSPVLFSSIYGGEDYDAQLEMNGWDAPGFNDSRWRTAKWVDGPALLRVQQAGAISVAERFSPVDVKLLQAGNSVYDLGQNFSGIPAIHVSGSAGDTVRITPGELLAADGTVSQKGSGGPFYFTYILKGSGDESWEPRFTYYGFRYLQVECIAGLNHRELPQVNSITGLHIRNAAPVAGNFSCSDSLFTKTYRLINWAIRSNMMSVFTDCPHREKLGWLEQTHLMGPSVQYNYDVETLYGKVVTDMMEAQTADGLIPEIAPEYVQFGEPFRDSPEWGSAMLLVPWSLYKWYGNEQVLREAYPAMLKYVNYLSANAGDSLLLMQGLGDWYDIGPNRPGFSQLTPKGLTATAFYYYDLVTMQQIASVLEKKMDAAKFEAMALRVKNAFNARFFDEVNGWYGTNSQAANAIALYMGLVPAAQRHRVEDNLVKDIVNRNYALTAGDIGYRYVLEALQQAGRSDIIFKMNNRDDVPGYGYQIKKGATALTESWQAYPSVSNNHFMLGHLMQWFYGGLCGINQSAHSVGFKEIEIRPQVVDGIDAAEAAYHCMYGWIRVAWNREDGKIKLRLSIPVNTTAVVMDGKGRRINIGSGNREMEW